MKVIFIPYCNFATIGFSEMKLKVMSTASHIYLKFWTRERGTYVNTRLFRENGIGRTINMNTAISAIRIMNTCRLGAVSAVIDQRGGH